MRNTAIRQEKICKQERCALLLYSETGAYLFFSKTVAILFLIRNDCCEFLASEDVILLSDHQSKISNY